MAPHNAMTSKEPIKVGEELPLNRRRPSPQTLAASLSMSMLKAPQKVPLESAKRCIYSLTSRLSRAPTRPRGFSTRPRGLQELPRGRAEFPRGRVNSKSATVNRYSTLLQ